MSYVHTIDEFVRKSLMMSDIRIIHKAHKKQKSQHMLTSLREGY